MEFEEAIHKYRKENYKSIFWNQVKASNIYRISASLYRLHMVLYTLDVIAIAPKKHYDRKNMIYYQFERLKHPAIANIIMQYIKKISQIKEKNTIRKTLLILHEFAKWLNDNYPNINNLNKLTREIIDDYFHFIKNYISIKTGKHYSQNYLASFISTLKVFFDESLHFGYSDVPQYKLLFNYDLVRKPRPLPRYILEQDLEKLMQAIHNIKCVYQKNALILLRWTGARREEIRRLDINALDYYTDSTPKLFIPIGKTNESRWIPIHQEAEAAFKELLEIRKSAGNLKGLPDRKTGHITDYLFMKRNYLLSSQYLFDKSMHKACVLANLLTNEGKHKYTSHQFRHTIGTQMANQGASLQTIMKMLGHQSPDMTIRYAQIYDETVKKDYQRTINKEIVIAGGEYAEQIKNQELRQDEIDWIKANFYKTYLLMGHCFHHTHEPMCDFADACYFCPKFVTTKDHLPKFIEKYTIENQLIEDAKIRGWDKEIDRHTHVAHRVKKIIDDLMT